MVISADNSQNTDENGNPLVSGSSNPSTGANVGSKTASTPTAGQGTSSNTNPTTSGSFTNLQNYITANSNFNNGQGLGAKVNNDLSNKGQNISNQANQGYSNFKNQADQNNIAAYDTNGNQTEGYSQAQSTLQNPTQASPDQVSNFTKYRDASYKGPTSIDNSATLQNNAQDFKTLTGQTQNEAGRFNLLSNLYGNPGYSGGQQGVDNLILQGDKKNLNNLKQSRSLGNAVSQNVNQNVNNAADLANQYTQNAATAQNATRDALTGAITGFDTNAAGAAKGYNDRLSSLEGNIAANKLTQNQLQGLGIDLGSTAYVNPLNYLNHAQATNQSIITPEQQQQINALAQLSGGVLSDNGTVNPNAILQSYANPATTQMGANPFDATAYNTANASTKGQYDTANSAITSQQQALVALKDAYMNPTGANAALLRGDYTSWGNNAGQGGYVGGNGELISRYNNQNDPTGYYRNGAMVSGPTYKADQAAIADQQAKIAALQRIYNPTVFNTYGNDTEAPVVQPNSAGSFTRGLR